MPGSGQPIIKICGIKTTESLEAVISAGADMVGLVHFAKSPRHAGLETIGALIEAAHKRIACVILLVNPNDTLVRQAAALGPDWLQLHGSERPERVAAISAMAHIKVMKAVAIGGARDVTRLLDYATVADRLVADAKPPKSANRPGGLGKTFDWTLLGTLDRAPGFMLSGGLNPDNVAEAVRQVGPLGLDVSSGVETAPGEKDPALIGAFVDAARTAARD